jgi:DNA-directed RNA polymerase specialized sigma24 family protein
MTPSPEDCADPVGLAYDRYAPGLFRYALVLLGDEAAAADAVHQVFAAWLRQRQSIDNDAHYLRRAVRNECYSALRRRQREASHDGPLLEAIDRAAADTEQQVAIERALRALPAEQREVVHFKLPFRSCSTAAVRRPLRARGSTRRSRSWIVRAI